MKNFIYLLLLTTISIPSFSFAQEKGEESFRKKALLLVLA